MLKKKRFSSKFKSVPSFDLYLTLKYTLKINNLSKEWDKLFHEFKKFK